MSRLPARAVAVTVLAMAAWVLAPLKPWGSADCAYGEATYQEAGESILHAFEPGPRPAAYHLPLASVLTACLRGHVDARARRAWLDAGEFVVPAAAALTGALAGGAAAGLAAGAAAAWGQPEPPCHPQAGLTFFLALSAAALVLWSRRPSSARAALLAAAAGASLALRSTLVFVAPAAALWAWVRGARRGALILALVPCAFPAVWAACNLTLHGRAAPFEMGQASSNLVAGALGLVGTVEGDLDALAPGLPDGLDSAATARWAAREALAHPRRTLDAMVARLVAVVLMSPWAWGFALIGLAAARRRPEARALALLAAGFVFLHILMAVQANYFIPLTPVLAVLATAPLWKRRARLGPAVDRPAGAAAAVVLAAGLAVGGGGAVWAAGLSVRHAWLSRARPVDSQAALHAALAASPRDAVLRLWEGRRKLALGEFAAAAEAFRAAQSGGLERARPLAAWAHLFERGAAPEAFQDLSGLSCAERAQSAMFEAEAAARSPRGGGAALARRALEARRACALARGGGGAALASDAAAVRGLLGELTQARPGDAKLLAPRLLAAALSPADAAAWRALAIGLQDLGDAEGALEAYGRVGSKAADLLADKAVALALAGRREEAKALLAEGLKADPALAAAALTLGALLEGEGRRDEARSVYEKALQAGGGNLRRELERRLGR